jgi:ParB family chromosome partitioning protein
MELPDQAKDGLRQGRITVGHAKLILSVADPSVLTRVTDACLSETLSVRQLEAALADGTLDGLGQLRRKQPKQPTQPKPAHLKELEKRLSETLGTKVTISEGATKGRIVIEFYSVSDFDGILAKLGVQ